MKDSKSQRYVVHPSNAGPESWYAQKPNKGSATRLANQLNKFSEKKYSVSPMAASKTDTSNHNGKYFQNISEGKPTIEKC